MKRDLTKGNVTNNLVAIAIPIILGSMAHTMYDLVDMAWVGRISAGAVAAITIFSAIFGLAFVLNNIVGNSSVSLISQSYGAGDPERTRKVVEQTLVFKALLAVIASLIIFPFLPFLLGLFTKDPQVLQDALAYGRIRVLMLPITFSSFTVATALRCVGDAKRAMHIMFVSAILNVVLDPLLIFERVPWIGIPGFGLGVFGAALATEISVTVAFLYGAWLLFSGKSHVQPGISGLLRLDWQIDRQLIIIGLPVSLESLLRNLSGSLVLGFVSVYGTIGMAAMGIVQRLISFFFVPMEGLLSAGSTIVGQNLGAAQVERADQTARAASRLGLIVMSVLAGIAALIPTQIVMIFTQVPAVVEMARAALLAILPMLVLLGFTLGRATALTGAGYNKPFLVAGLVSRWLVQIPFLYVAVQVLHLSFAYTALSFAVAEVAEAAILLYAYYRGQWRTWRVIPTASEVPVPAEAALAESGT